MAERRPRHRALRLDSSHWRADGQAQVRYDTQADALWAAEERSAESGADLHVYQCPYCHGWHMGSRD
jgi:hypothetical protein